MSVYFVYVLFPWFVSLYLIFFLSFFFLSGDDDGMGQGPRLCIYSHQVLPAS